MFPKGEEGKVASPCMGCRQPQEIIKKKRNVFHLMMKSQHVDQHKNQKMLSNNSVRLAALFVQL